MKSAVFVAALFTFFMTSCRAPQKQENIVVQPTEKKQQTMGLTSQEIDSIVRTDFASIQSCYGVSFEDPSTPGQKVRARFVIAADGSVSEASLLDTPNEPGVSECIRQHLLDLQFPEPRNKGTVRVTYPFAFGNTNECHLE